MKLKNDGLISTLGCREVLWCRFGASLNVSHLDVDADRQLAWVIDTTGQVWFTTGVSADQPHGSGHWWQVSRDM